MKKKTECSSEMYAPIYQTTRHQIPQYITLHSHHHDNLKSQTIIRSSNMWQLRHVETAKNRSHIHKEILYNSGNDCYHSAPTPFPPPAHFLNNKVRWICPCSPMKAYRKRRGTLPLILELGTRWRWVADATPQPLYPPGKNLGTHRIGGYATILPIIR
jgi:hypothetical protein